MPRQRDDAETIIEVVFKTLPKTFEGDAIWVTEMPEEVVTLLPPATRPRPTAPVDEEEEDEPEPPRTTAVRPRPTSVVEDEDEDEDEAEETGRETPSFRPTTLVLATSSPTLTGTIISATGLPEASNTDSPVASSTAAAEASEGMSGGAKAGLALGILFAVGALLGGVLFLYRRKKNQAAKDATLNEKTEMQNAPMPPPAVVEPAPSNNSQRNLAAAPRLSLRPVTQFDPSFEQRKSAGNLLNIAAAAGAAGAAAGGAATLSPQQPNSPWERPGAANAPAQNPFNDPVSPISRFNTPPQNPFENAAAVVPPNAQAPMTGPPNDFANPAPAIAAATAAAAAARNGNGQSDLPPPPGVNPDMAPPSPAWTDDIPASPGPAPSGPPPIAVAGGMPNGPAPGPAGPNNVHRVQLDFKPSMQDELELRAGQLVRMLHEYDDGWVNYTCK